MFLSTDSKITICDIYLQTTVTCTCYYLDGHQELKCIKQFNPAQSQFDLEEQFYYPLVYKKMCLKY